MANKSRFVGKQQSTIFTYKSNFRVCMCVYEVVIIINKYKVGLILKLKPSAMNCVFVPVTLNIENFMLERDIRTPMEYR